MGTSDVWISGEQRNDLTVFFMQVGEFNPAFEQFLKFINGIKYRGESDVRTKRATLMIHSHLTHFFLWVWGQKLFISYKSVLSYFQTGRSESAGSRFQHQSAAAGTFGWVLSLWRLTDDSSVLSQRPVDGVQESCHNISQTGAMSAVVKSNFQTFFIWRAPLI